MEKWQLKQKQSLPLEAKIIMTKRRIREWLLHFNGNVYISFSGGKDSTVLLDIARQVHSNLEAVFCDMGLQFPEVRKFAKSKDNITVIKPKMNFKDVIEKYGYPVVSKEQAQYITEYRNTNSDKLRDKRWNGVNGSYKISEKWKFLTEAPFKISHKCCDVMKKRPFKRYEKETENKAIVGTMVEESRGRLNSYLRNGCNAFDSKRPMGKPMSFWTEQDILRYLREKDIDYCKEVYGKIKGEDQLYTTGRSRTGCVFCAFGAHMEDKPNRFQRLAETHPKLHNYCINKLGMKEVLEYINIPYTPRPKLDLKFGGDN